MAAEDSRNTANNNDSLLELETSVFVLIHSTAPPKKTKVTQTCFKSLQKRWKLMPMRLHYHVLATATGVPRLIA